MNPTDDEVLAALPVDGSIGTRELAERLGMLSKRGIRRLDNQLNRMECEGRIHIDRPGGGVTSSERQIRRDGDTVESLRAQLARSQEVVKAATEARNILNQALGGSR